MFRLPSGGHLARWRKDTATVDLLFGSVQPARWDNYPSVTQQWTALWQVVAARDLSTLTLSMELVNPPRDAHAGWDTGQSEAAITVYSSAGQISLGGPDTEWLHSIAAVGEGLPARWAKLLDEYSDSYDSTFRVEYTGVGTLTWHLPNMKQAEFAQLCLSLAWVSPPNDDVCTTVSLTSSAAAAMEELLAPKRPQRSLANDVTSGEL
ncbi:MAG: hypothetical protein DLM55_02250 [Acidimicrobiales bacterium]|nr:MAG: hypothetical protein DLM55_02250 [Acidimicrobiales bacterium]